MPESPLFSSNKMITIVRNPLDVIISWINLVALCNHYQKSPFSYHEDYPEWWDWWVKSLSKKMGQWYRTQMHDARLRNVPTLWIRFEDLVNDPEPQLMNIMRFMIGEKDISGTNAERRVKEVIALGADATRTYKLKNTTNKFNGSAHAYN